MNAKIIIATIIISMTMAMMIGIHRGEVTQNHDHVMRSVSLSVRKIRNSTIGRPIPEVVLDDDMCYF